MITFKTLEKTSLDEILIAFNSAFSDYIVPMQITKEQLLGKIKSENIQLQFSVGAFEDNQLIAFMLHGFAEHDGQKMLYNGGTGVIPAQRGRGLTFQLYEYLIPLLKNQNISSVQLEVITTNAPAIATYEKTGFIITRKVHCYKGLLSSDQSMNTDIVDVSAAFDWKTAASFCDSQPTWQNDVNAIENNKENLISLSIHDQSQLVSYAIYNPLGKRILQLATAKTYRNQGLASQLLGYISQHYTSEVSITNVDSADSASNRFIEHLGLQHTVDQYEMVLQL